MRDRRRERSGERTSGNGAILSGPERSIPDIAKAIGSPRPAPQMRPPIPLLRELDTALACADSARRARIANGITALFAGRKDAFDHPAHALFETVFEHLAKGADPILMASMAEGLADLAHAPAALIRRFAHDADPIVAGPVLARSPQLAEADIAATAVRCSAAHLLAIVQRPDLSEDLAALLIARADRPAIDRLAINPHARFRIGDFSTLLGRASADDRGRVLTCQPADILTSNGSIAARATMIDISPGGAKLELATAPPLSDGIAIRLPNVEDFRLQGRIVWRARGKLGIQFYQLPEALFAARAQAAVV